jgi:hypothetical protein
MGQAINVWGKIQMETRTDRPIWVRAMLALPREEYRLWSYLHWRQGNNSDAWPSQRAIATDLGLTVQGVRKITRRLQDKGWLRIESPEDCGRSHGLRYAVAEGSTAVDRSQKKKVNGGSPFKGQKGSTPVYPCDEERVNDRHPKGSTPVYPCDTERVNSRNPKGSTKARSHKGRTLDKNTNSSNARTDETKATHGKGLFGEPDPMGSPGVNPTANGEYFERFWSEYPNKVKRIKCQEIWQRLKLTPAQAERVIEAVRRYKRTDQWQKDDGQFVPHPSTFLNQRRWEDEIPAKPEPKRGDPDWDPTDEEGLAIFRECGVEMKPGPMSQEDCERMSRELGVKIRPAEA